MQPEWSRIHRSAHHAVVKVGKRISTTREKWAPKKREKMEETLSVRLFWLYTIMKYLFSICWGIPHIIFAAVDLYFTVNHWCFCPAIFLSFITSDCLFLCVCLNTVFFHFFYTFPFFYHSESYSSFLEGTCVALFKPVLEVKSQRRSPLLN